MPFPIDLIRQLRQVYLDMPGLSLTPAQMLRLYTADQDDCEVALAALVDTGLLTRRGDQYVRTITGELPPGEAMRLRAAPWDCRWAEPVFAAQAPLWVEASCGGWTCVRVGGPRVLDVRDCRTCQRWEPLLTTRRRAYRATLSPEFSGPSSVQPPARHEPLSRDLGPDQAARDGQDSEALPLYDANPNLDGGIRR